MTEKLFGLLPFFVCALLLSPLNKCELEEEEDEEVPNDEKITQRCTRIAHTYTTKLKGKLWVKHQWRDSSDNCTKYCFKYNFPLQVGPNVQLYIISTDHKNYALLVACIKEGKSRLLNLIIFTTTLTPPQYMYDNVRNALKNCGLSDAKLNTCINNGNQDIDGDGLDELAYLTQ